MKSHIVLSVAIGTAALAFASAALAGNQPAPAPLIGAGLPGLAVLAVAGGGYLAIRLRRRGKD